MTKEDIKLLLEAGLAGAQTHIDGDDGVHFAARVVFAGFAGLTPVKRHQLVYRALGDNMRQAIHALSIQTYTPEEWQLAQPFATL
ncbi:MAG: BolA/IbaG family iron-sulfur metabolism protein [Gammaproteobacteria bacterium]|nr:BolA/IbaG family iron-sulfur metabolism protein [Gammaproteobacteria bacterium]